MAGYYLTRFISNKISQNIGQAYNTNQLIILIYHNQSIHSLLSDRTEYRMQCVIQSTCMNSRIVLWSCLHRISYRHVQLFIFPRYSNTLFHPLQNLLPFLFCILTITSIVSYTFSTTLFLSTIGTALILCSANILMTWITGVDMDAVAMLSYVPIRNSDKGWRNALVCLN